MDQHPTSRRIASVCAYSAAILFAICIPMFGMAAQSTTIMIVVSVLAAVFHLLLFPVVAALRGPEWVRAFGYGWLSIDTTLNIMALNGGDYRLAMQIRLGIHIL